MLEHPPHEDKGMDGFSRMAFRRKPQTFDDSDMEDEECSGRCLERFAHGAFRGDLAWASIINFLKYVPDLSSREIKMWTFIKEGILLPVHWQYEIKVRLYNSTSVCLNNSYAILSHCINFNAWLSMSVGRRGAVVIVSLSSVTSWVSRTSTPPSVYSVSQCRTWLAAGKSCNVAANRQALTCSNHLQVSRRYFSPGMFCMWKRSGIVHWSCMTRGV